MRWLMTRLMWVSAIFLLVWLAVVIYWQGTAHSPSESDLWVYLALIPLLLAASVWGIYKLAFQPKAAPAEPASAPVDAAAKRSAEQAALRAGVERSWTLHLMATSLHTSAGLSAQEVLGKLTGGAIETELDPELKNAAGFAVFSARIAGLDTTDIQAALEQLPPPGEDPTPLVWNGSQYRTLQLAATSLAELGSQAMTHAGFAQQMQLEDEGRTISDAQAIRLRLVLVWPGHWSAIHQAQASQWAKTVIASQGWPEQWMVVHEVRAEHANPIALLDRICVAAYQGQLPTVGLMLVCDSAIDQETVDAWEQAGNLFGGANAQGAKPGEVAAGFVFADPVQSQQFGDGPFPALHRASWAVRDKSADARGRTTAILLGELTAQALGSAQLAPDAIALISADHDHKPRREAELCEMLSAQFPELDPMVDAVRVAQACGSTAHCTTVAAICIAHQYVVDEQAPALCVSLQDPYLRAAVVISAPAAAAA